MKCRIVGNILDAQTKKKIPARITVRSGDVIRTSASGRTYGSGSRFYADGKFWVECKPGRIEIEVSRGFDYAPACESIKAAEGRTIIKKFLLKKWADMRKLGWFCGDNHWHLCHDDLSKVPGLENPPDWKYARLVLRAEGLDYGTEQGSILNNIANCKLQIAKLKSKNPFITAEKEIKHALDGHYAVMDGMKIVTHPFGNIPALNWLTAVRVFSDVVLGNTPEGFDVFCYKKEAEQLMYFLLLNMGARIPGTASTDACLERKFSVCPGSKRVYTCGSDGLSGPENAAKCIRNGNNFVTDGPVFVIFDVDGAAPGSTVIPELGKTYTARVQVFALNRISSIEVIRNGNTVKEFKSLMKQKNYRFRMFYDFKEKGSAWYTVRVTDEYGRSALSNPVYFENPIKTEKFRYSLLCCLGNFTADNTLGNKFFLHARCAVGQGVIKKVFIFKDGIPSQELPLSLSTGSRTAQGEYKPYFYVQNTGKPQYFEVCYPLESPGYYHVHVETSGGILLNQPMLYDVSSPNSHQISYLRAGDSVNNIEIKGWCEDIPLNEVGKDPGYNCWFRKDRAWEMRASFSGVEYKLREGTDLSAYFADL